MKLLSLATISALVALPMLALAGTNNLGDTMKDMGAQMKVLAPALLKGQATSADALKAASAQLVKDVTDASGRLPDQLVDDAGAPLAAQSAAIAQYNGLMAQLLTAVTKLDTAVQAGDNSTAATVLKGEVLPIEQQGHGAFNN